MKPIEFSLLLGGREEREDTIFFFSLTQIVYSIFSANKTCCEQGTWCKSVDPCGESVG